MEKKTITKIKKYGSSLSLEEKIRNSLIFVIAVIFILYIETKSTPFFGDLFLGIFIECIGILLTFLFIDAVIQNNESRKRKGDSVDALIFLKGYLRSHLIFIYNIPCYIVEQRKLESFDQFDESFFLEMSNLFTSLDKNKHAPRISEKGQQRYLRLNLLRFLNFKNDIELFLSTYLVILTQVPDYTKLILYLQMLRSNGFYTIIESTYLFEGNIQSQLVFNDPSFRDYVDHLIKTCQIYDSIVEPRFRIFENL